MTARALLLFVVLSAPLGAAAQSDQALARDDAETVRLPPSAFRDIPGDIRKDLERRGCTVPQAYSNKTPHNVIRGRFITPKQWDLAVLCSREHVSTVLVFRGEKTKSVDELGAEPDATFLRDVGGATGYARSLSVAEPDYIMQRNARYAGPKPKFDHEGIEDLYIQKGSAVWYWSDGKWLPLHGSD
jgi:hypothetical protein